MWSVGAPGESGADIAFPVVGEALDEGGGVVGHRALLASQRAVGADSFSSDRERG